jgi:hypothetical protein
MIFCLGIVVLTLVLQATSCNIPKRMGWDIMSFCATSVLVDKFLQTVCMFSTNRHFVKHIACNTNTPEIEKTIFGVLL